MGTTIGAELEVVRQAGNAASNCEIPNPIVRNQRKLLRCSDKVIMTQHTFVHELGHVFDAISSLTGNPLRNRSAGLTGPSTLRDINNRPVIGIHDNKNFIWYRGDTGIGSAPKYPANGFYDLARPPFQQNPENTDYELAADMFLNWVYRTINRGGFLDRTWRSDDFSEYLDPRSQTPLTCSQYWLGCPDAGNPGLTRFNWINGEIIQILQQIVN
jgi:hypothetical protein